MRVSLLGVLVALVVASAAVPVVASDRAVVAGLDRPVPGAVLAGFDAPTRYGPGHRGVDLAAPPGSPVRAAATGRVTFAGRVVDATWVTVDHGAVRTTVGPLRTVAVARGRLVARGEVLGTSGHAHGLRAVHWSARRGDTYIDPLGAGLGRGIGVATLLPTRPVGGSVRSRSDSGPVRTWPGRRVR